MGANRKLILESNAGERAAHMTATHRTANHRDRRARAVLHRAEASSPHTIGYGKLEARRGRLTRILREKTAELTQNLRDETQRARMEDFLRRHWEYYVSLCRAYVVHAPYHNEDVRKFIAFGAMLAFASVQKAVYSGSPAPEVEAWFDLDLPLALAPQSTKRDLHHLVAMKI